MDYERRQAAVRARYPGGAVVRDPANIAYLTGVHVHPGPARPCRLELPAGRPIRLVLNRVYAAVAPWATCYFDGEAPPPEDRLEPADSFVAALRLEKDEEEISQIRTAAALASWAQEVFRSAITPGRSFLELRFAVAHALAQEASRRDPTAHWEFRVGSVAGPASESPHAPAGHSGRPLVPGDVIEAVIVVGYNGYHAECERTYVLGKPTDAIRAAFDAMLRAQDAALGACSPGEPISEIDRRSRAVIEAAGYAAAIRHRAGHGMGLAQQENPLDSPVNQDRFKAGMVMAIEPGIYLPGVGGFRHSDVVLVGQGILTSFPRDLDSLTVPA